MSAINEAYRVLSDPGRRAQYDRGIDGTVASTAGSAAPRSADSTQHDWSSARAGRYNYPDELAPARIPWKLLTTMAVLGVGLVLVGAAFIEPAPDRGPDGILETGSCVAIEANGDASEVACSDGTDLVVERLIPAGQNCAAGTTAHRDRQGLGTACIRPSDG